jgi:hypothetical protein
MGIYSGGVWLFLTHAVRRLLQCEGTDWGFFCAVNEIKSTIRARTRQGSFKMHWPRNKDPVAGARKAGDTMAAVGYCGLPC